MIDPQDFQLDQQLRDVALPKGLLARLQNIARHEPSASDADLALFSDDALDEQLCGLELPAGLIERVQRTVAITAGDEALEAALVNVPLPRALIASLQTIPWESQRRARARFAVAALWFCMVSIGYFGGLNLFLSQFQPRQPEELAWLVVNQPLLLSQAAADDLAVELVTTPQVDATAEPLLVEVAAPPPALLLAESSFPAGPFGELNTQLQGGLRPWQDLLVLRWGVLGSPSDASDRLPPLEALPAPRSGGMKLPLVRGYDRQFVLTHGVQPVVSPQSHAELRSVQVSLNVSDAGFARVAQRLAAGRLPDAAEIHVADFLAAMTYPLPATSPEQVSILAAAGPSPFGAPLGTSPAQLLQVAVQAGPLAEVARSPVHLTVALDISASMNMSGRLSAAKLALLHLLDELGPQDRLSLLLFNDRNAYEVIAARREHAESLRALLLQLEGAGGTDLAAAMQRAASLAMSEVDLPSVRRQLVVITDGRAHVSSGTLRSLSALLGDLTLQGLTCSVVDVSSDEEPDEQLQKLMVAVPGKLHHARVAADCQWLLVEKLRGRTTMVAPDTTLQVTFDPQAVAAYRLIGHEPTRLAGLEPQAVSIDLRAGQVATGLFELWLKPNSHDDVATAVVTWLDPATAEPRRSEQRISRLQFAPSFAEAALSLQAAAVAAQTGEVLKQSPFAASRNRDLQAVQELAARVNPRLAQRGEFQRYLEFVQTAERVRARP